MGSRRQSRKKGCLNKQKYPDENTARKYLQRFTAYRHSVGDWSYMHAYRCEYCGGWHIGHVVGQHKFGFVRI